MNTVKIKLNDKGSIVTPYKNNKAFGYVQLISEQFVIQGSWARNKKRSTLMRGDVDVLEQAFGAIDSLPGKIRVVECTEHDIPNECIAMLDKNKDFEEQIAGFVKTAGEDGADLKIDDARILHFYFYDETGKIADIRVQHDTIAE